MMAGMKCASRHGEGVKGGGGASGMHNTLWNLFPVELPQLVQQMGVL